METLLALGYPDQRSAEAAARLQAGWCDGYAVMVVELFAFFHDVCRENEGTDPAHGARGADFAAVLRGELYQLEDSAFALLQEAR